MENIERLLQNEIKKREKAIARGEIENCKSIEDLRMMALALFDQNEAHKQLALTVMKTHLTGE